MIRMINEIEKDSKRIKMNSWMNSKRVQINSWMKQEDNIGYKKEIQ
jgi:hypothetical protein